MAGKKKRSAGGKKAKKAKRGAAGRAKSAARAKRPAAESPANPFDPQQVLDRLKVPGVNVKGLLEHERQNIRAVVEANQVALNSLQTLVKRQTEIVRTALTDAMEAGRAQGSSGLDEGARRARVVQEALAKAVASMRELAELTGQSSREAMGILERRYQEAVEEIRSALRSGDLRS